eukprot:GFUD01036024.1.p1 GENE.GFUD01036024.1~~GFUD01036024.1.p1  ORF type:complete len:202 (-),score=65.58 GFUD01036024.1:144-749(-)
MLSPIPISILLTTLAMVTSRQVAVHQKLVENMKAGVEPFAHNVTAVCEDGAKYCENPPEYPTDVISKVLLGNRRLKRSVRNQMESQMAHNDSSVMDSVCPMKRYFMRPRVATNQQGKLMFVVNGVEGREERQEYVQEVEVGECIETELECGNGDVFIYESTYCKQQYSKTELWSMTEEGEVMVDTFSFPSSCDCWVRVMEL